nr:MAG TPA_asm: hypothetical protein [Bacteriophage sp.]
MVVKPVLAISILIMESVMPIPMLAIYIQIHLGIITLPLGKR